jgi:hypothetical protein
MINKLSPNYNELSKNPTVARKLFKGKPTIWSPKNDLLSLSIKRRICENPKLKSSIDHE